MTDDVLRTALVHHIDIGACEPFRLPAKTSRGLAKGVGLPKWVKVLDRRILKWPEHETPEGEQLREATASALDKLKGQLSGIPDALRPIIEQWRREQKEKAE
jgi:hypothetical protein